MREPFDFRRGGRRPVHRHQRHAQLIGERRQHVALRDEPHIDQNLAELVAALRLQFERALQVFGLDLLPLDQDLAQALVARRPGAPVGYPVRELE